MLATKFLKETVGKLLIESSQFSELFLQKRFVLADDYDLLMHRTDDFDRIVLEKKLDFFCAKPVSWEQFDPLPEKNYTIAAVDGSQIISDDLEVNTPSFILVNIGLIQTNYPKQEVVHFESFPTMISDHQDVANIARDTPLYRTQCEFKVARDTISNMVSDNVLLIDGGLLQWHLTESKSDQKEEILSQVSSTFKEASSKEVHLLGYISGTNASDVMGTLRLFHCQQKSKCQLCPDEYCIVAKQVKDELLFLEILPYDKQKKWNISPIFKSNAPMIAEYYEQDIYFFYLYHQFEFARIECLEHSLQDLPYLIGVLEDQLEKGAGYPLVLKEAHELAVLQQKDKMTIENFLLQQTKQYNFTPRCRAKNLAKKIKYI